MEVAYPVGDHWSILYFVLFLRSSPPLIFYSFCTQARGILNTNEKYKTLTLGFYVNF